MPFRRSSTYENMVARRTRCGVVEYANEFHVDVVPRITRGSSSYITNRHANRLERN